jgi:hypothetical protein
MDRSARSSVMGRTKAGPDAAIVAIGAPEGTRVPQGTSHRILRFSARHPPSSPGRFPRRGKEFACLL